MLNVEPWEAKGQKSLPTKSENCKKNLENIPMALTSLVWLLTLTLKNCLSGKGYYM
jgi:hypothetical protein